MTPLLKLITAMLWICLIEEYWVLRIIDDSMTDDSADDSQIYNISNVNAGGRLQ